MLRRGPSAWWRVFTVAMAILLLQSSIVTGGDGDGYGIGLGHFVHAMRRNFDMTYVVRP